MTKYNKIKINNGLNSKSSSKLRMYGFTLVELLAVIVILAIILVIAVPKVMSVIEDAKKATLESTAKMIANAAEKQKIQNQVLGKTDEITCKSVAKINDIDYESCEITFENNTAKVTIVGKGKFAGMQIVNATKNNAVVTDVKIETPLKYGRLYKDENLSYVFYDDGSAMFSSGADSMEQYPYNTVLYEENKISSDGYELNFSVEGNTVNVADITAELDESPLYYGLPYVGEFEGINISYIFYPYSKSAIFIDNKLEGTFDFTIDSLKVSFSDHELELSTDGKLLKIADSSVTLKLIENPVYFKEPYSAEMEGIKASLIFSKSGVMNYSFGDESIDMKVLYLDGFVFVVDASLAIVSDNKNNIIVDDVLLTLENIPQREIIPEGGIYISGYVWDSNTLTFDESNTITYKAGDYFPETPQLGDRYIYGDYEYRYAMLKVLPRGWEIVSEITSGWGVNVLDTTKTEYNAMLSFINNETVNYASYTYSDCTSLIKSPKIPLTITIMQGTFKGCTSLTSAPVIEKNVSTITEVFYGCTNLSGTVEINTDTTNYIKALYGTQVTEVIGNTPYKSEILATKN